MERPAYILVLIILMEAAVIGYLTLTPWTDNPRTGYSGIAAGTSPCQPTNITEPGVLEPRTIRMRHGGKATPSFLVKSNRHGLREEPFTARGRDNITRILVIGDSFTFGWGVNRSHRYTEILERRLNNGTNQRYEVINAGIPEWGMRDYYVFLKTRGVRYEPDVLVVGFTSADEISSRVKQELIQYAKEGPPHNVTNRRGYVAERLKHLKYAYKEQRISGNNLSSSSLVCYLQHIAMTAHTNNITPLFYHLWPNTRFTRRIRPFVEEANATLITLPDIFDREPKGRWTHGRGDRHFNRHGHRWVAGRLYHGIRNHTDALQDTG